MKVDKDWADKKLKAALEATDVYIYAGKIDPKTKNLEKESEEPAVLVKFRVTSKIVE
jgi:hypothetical protein